MTPEAYNAVLAKLPPLMLRLTKHDGLVDQTLTIIDTYKLQRPQMNAFMELQRMLIAQLITPSQVEAYVRQQMKFDEPTTKKFTLDVLGRICLPMQWYIGNVDTLIQALGGNVAQCQAEAEKKFPDIYGLPGSTVTGDIPPAVVSQAVDDDVITHLDEALTNNKGRAGILLRLSSLSQEIEGHVAAHDIPEATGQELLHSLDGLSYAVNTKDLSPLEVAAIKRKLKSVIAKIGRHTT